MKKKKIIIVVIITIILSALFLPLLIDYINVNNAFKVIETKTKEVIDKGKEEADSDYSEYYNIKSLKYDITRIYKTNTFDEYGYEITFSVDSDYSVSYYYGDIEYSLMIYSLDDLLKESIDYLDDNDVNIAHYKLTLIFNGEEVYHDYKGSNYSIYDEYIEDEYKEYGVEVEKNELLWEYVDGDIKIKSVPGHIIIVLWTLFIILVIILIVFIVNYYEKHASVDTKVSVGCFGEIIKFLIIYILIGIFSGGVGFFALPILWLLDNRNK